MMALALCALLGAAVFDVQTLPIANVEAQVMFAPADGDEVPDLFVIDNQTVTMYPSRGGHPLALRLPEGTSVVDLFDVAGDGQVALLALHGGTVLKYELDEGGLAAGPQLLFRASTPLNEPRPQPVPYVMGLMWEGRPVVALPEASRLVLRSLEGEEIAAFPISAAPGAGIDYSRPLHVRSVEPNQVGSGTALELRVSIIEDIEPHLPDALAPPPQPLRSRPATLSHAREAAGGDPSTWPWFPLAADGDSPARVFYALEPPEFRDTLIRIGPLEAGEAAGAGQAFRYPGALFAYSEGSLPDFNGDGYTDLFLWKSPIPGISLDALTRAAVGGTWPLTTTIHLYAPEKGRFEPRPHSPIRHQAPVAWFMTTEQGSPLRNVVLNDFNGDGRTDFGCSDGPNSFAIWLYNDGFSQRPDFRHSFPQPLGRLEATLDAAQDGVVALVFRSPSAFHVIRVTGRG
jgi:hypothetical protein